MLETRVETLEGTSAMVCRGPQSCSGSAHFYCPGDSDEAFFRQNPKTIHTFGGEGEGRIWADATSARMQSSGAMVGRSEPRFKAQMITTDE